MPECHNPDYWRALWVSGDSSLEQRIDKLKVWQV